MCCSFFVTILLIHCNYHLLPENYVPLQDSQQYLAGLESKLARIQGRTASNRKTESRRLLDALAGSRSHQTAQLMQDTESPCGSIPTIDTPPSSSTIDPQGEVTTFCLIKYFVNICFLLFICASKLLKMSNIYSNLFHNVTCILKRSYLKMKEANL